MPARKNRPGKCGTPGYFGPIVTTPEERLLLAIFGKPDGLSVDEAVRRMRMSSTPGVRTPEATSNRAPQTLPDDGDV